MRLKEQLTKDTPYITLYKFLLDLGIIPAVILSKLIDADSYTYCRLSEDPAYFECTDTFIQSELKLSSPTLRKYIDDFVDQGFIFVRKIEKNGFKHRFIKLNEEKLLDKYKKFELAKYSEDDNTADVFVYVKK